MKPRSPDYILAEIWRATVGPRTFEHEGLDTLNLWPRWSPEWVLFEAWLTSRPIPFGLSGVVKRANNEPRPVKKGEILRRGLNRFLKR